VVRCIAPVDPDGVVLVSTVSVVLSVAVKALVGFVHASCGTNTTTRRFTCLPTRSSTGGMCRIVTDASASGIDSVLFVRDFTSSCTACTI
jgi:hypothetical protein